MLKRASGGRAQSKIRQPVRERPRVEALDRRILLAAAGALPANVFAAFEGAVPPSGSAVDFPIHLLGGNFRFSVGNTLSLGFSIELPTGSTLSPTVKLRDGGGRVVSPFPPTRPSSRATLYRLAAGNYSVSVGGAWLTSGPFQLRAFLPGDANGDRKVNAADTLVIGNLITEQTYQASADADLDGRVAFDDLLVQVANLGASTTVSPFDVTVGLSPAPTASLPDGTPLVGRPAQTVSGLAAAGARVALDLNGNNVSSGTAVAGADGTYQIPLTLTEGANVITARATDAFGQVRTASTRVALDSVAPALSAGLTADTGDSATDGVTSDPSVSGIVTDVVGVGALRAALDSAAPSAFRDVSGALRPNGVFLLTRTVLEQTFGGTLADGPHTLRLQASDLAGNASAVAQVSFTLDTTAPSAPTLGLDPAFDTPPVGDNTTAVATVDAVGITEPGSGVRLLSGATTLATVVAGGDGRFRFAGVTLAAGANPFTTVATDAAGNQSSSGATFTRVAGGPPAVTARLGRDTGRSAADGITSDPSVSGAVTAASAISGFAAGFDARPESTFVNLLPRLAADGTFTLSAADVVSVNGGIPLADGPHTLHLLAEDSAGRRGLYDLTFTLDATNPTPPSVALSGGGFRTSDGTVTLAGATEPGAVVTFSTGAVVTAAGDGAFTFGNVALAAGPNLFTATAVDVAGNAASANCVVFRVSAVQSGGQAALEWNNATLAAIQANASTPEYASRALAIVSAAMYDAANSVNNSTSALYARFPAPAGASDVAAVAQAAHDTLDYLYPTQRQTFDDLLSAQVAAIADAQARAGGAEIGGRVAAAIIAMRQGDGSLGYVEYAPSSGPGAWQPTFPAYLPAESPQWATITPFLLTSPAQFRPAGPPSLDGAQWQGDYEQVRSLGSATSATRTADQTLSARFWADPTGTSTPPGHWNMIASALAAQRGLNLPEVTRLLAQLNVAMADAAIACWDAKYAYDFWRPITAIHAGGGNAGLTADPDWRPLLGTPPFPEYTSGHSTFSAAAATVLAATFGPNTSFAIGTTSPAVPAGLTRSFGSFDAAADEAAMSRIFGGIHFGAAVQDGMTAGRAIGRYILEKFTETADTAAPVVTYDAAQDRAASAAFGITGLVTDNLSGVDALTARFDDGSAFPVAFDATGRFNVSTAPLSGAADGTHVLHLTAFDRAGNASGAYDYRFALDHSAPTIALSAPNAGAVLALDAAVTGIVSGTGSPVVALSYRFDGGPPHPIVFDEAGAFDQFLDLGLLPPGGYALHVTATDAAGNSATATVAVTLPSLAPTVLGITPQDGSEDVGTTFRPKVAFSRPIDPATLTPDSFFMTGLSGAKLAASIVVSDDRRFAYLFPLAPLPGASAVAVTLDGTKVRARDGAFVDAAFNQSPSGSALTWRFTTVSLAPVPGTSLSGTVADPGPDFKPGTRDDVQIGPDGVIGSADDVYRLPLAGVTISILGTSLSTVTDAQGRFSFPAVPAGVIKLDVDGNTAVNAPAGYYFPSMVMDLWMNAGSANTVMAAMQANGMGNAGPGDPAPAAPGVYLPRLLTSILQPVAGTGVTTIGLEVGSAPDLTDERREALSLDVAADSAVGPDGRRLDDFQIGVSAVPPQLVADMLPPGVLQHTFDITIQAPGVAAFTTPVPMTFPNVFDAAPGTHLDFLSFDHTTGRLVIEGTATVSADGLTVRTDPRTGITHPGWHGVTPPGICAGSGGPPPAPPTPLPPAPDVPPGGGEADGPVATAVPPPVEPTEVVRVHDPVALPFTVGNTEQTLFSELWKADPPNVNLPPLPPAPGCDVPRHRNDKQQPFWNITIEVDGPLDEFAKSTKPNDLPPKSQSFTLCAGNEKAVEFNLTSKTYDEMFGPGGYQALDKDHLYGARIKITEIRQKAGGERTRDVYTYLVYRWVDVVDGSLRRHFGDTAVFLKTLVDFDREKSVGMHLPEGGETSFDGQAGPLLSVFDVGDGVSGQQVATWHYTPLIAEEQRERFEIKATDPDSGSAINVGRIFLYGLGVDPIKINPQILNFQKKLEAVITSLVQSAGNDSVFGNSDDIIGYLYTVNGAQDGVVASHRFRQEFAGFMPQDKFPGPDGLRGTFDDFFLPIQLDALRLKVAQVGEELLDHLRDKYVFLLNHALQPLAFTGSEQGDILVGWVDRVSGVGGETLRADDKVIRSVLPDATIPNAAKEWALAQALNEGAPVGGFGQFFTLMNTSFAMDWTSDISFAAYTANVLAHELAHFFGLSDYYSNGANGANKNENPIPDLMNLASTSDGIKHFTPPSRDLLLAAAGVTPNGVGTLAPALRVYRKNINLPGSTTGLQTRTDPNDPLPELGLLASGIGLANGDPFNIGQTSLNRAVVTEVVLVNPANVPLAISAVTLGSGTAGFSFSGVGPGAIIPANRSQAFSVTFNPSVAGDATDSLVITSNARVNSVFELPLRGSGVSPAPSARLKVGLNNLGGAAPGQSRARANVFTVTNDGLEPLTITGLAVVEGGDSFKLTGVPADLAGDPIVLPFGSSFSFGVAFTPSGLGVRRGRINVTTNDPSQPLVHTGVIGTGVEEVPAAGWGNDFVAVKTRGARQNTVRVRSDAAGNFSVFLPPSTPYEIVVFDPATGLVSHGFGTTAPSGQATDMTATLVFAASTAPDTDGDGLPDDVELAVGTAASSADTDRDGLDDFVEIEQGLDPFGGRTVPTGVVAALPLLGEAKQVVLEGATDGGEGQRAYVATGAYGLAVVDASRFQQPRVLSQIDLPGSAVDVAVDSGVGVAAVAAGAGGLHLIDVSDADAPALLQTVSETIEQVEVLDGIAYAVVGRRLDAYDLLTGDFLGSLGLANSTITGLARQGSFLYTIDQSNVLSVVEVAGGNMTRRGTVSLFAGGTTVFVGGGVAYVSAGTGFSTVDVSDPDRPAVISNPASNNLAVKSLAANGSGLAVGVGAPVGPTGTILALDVVDVSDPADTANFVTRVMLPARPEAVVIGSGIAFVADGAGGLVVVNYLPFDTGGEAPSVAISTVTEDVDPAAPGVQVLEGITIDVRTAIADDVQVRNVELLVNGRVVSNDVSFPFELAAVALATGAPVARVQVRATDTGGNQSLSNELVFVLLPDGTPPAVSAITPGDGATAEAGLRRITVEFSEPMHPAGLVPGTFALTSAGADGQFETADDTVVPFQFQTREQGRVVPLTFAALGPGRYRVGLDASALRDRAGNPLSGTNFSSTFTLRAPVEPFAVVGLEPNFGVGQTPTSVAAGNLDGDGDVDLVTANATSDTVTVLLADGRGGYARSDFAVGRGARSVALGDMDADGDLDLVTANYGGLTVSVLVNDGVGEFGARRDFSAGSTGPNFVTTGDLDRDGDLDLVVARSAGDGGLSVLRNNGAGGFGAPQEIPTGFGARTESVAVGDLDVDGDLDLVAANSAANSVGVFRNNGSGTFSPQQSVTVWNNPRGVALGDLDGDGDLDVVTSHGAGGNFSVIRNNGASPWARADVSLEGFTNAVALRDLDNDQDLDLALVGGSASATAWVARNDGAGSFAAPTAYAVPLPGGVLQSLAVADLDADGDADLAAVGSNPPAVSIVRNDGSGGFGRPMTLTGQQPSAVAQGDIDGDGDADLVTANVSSGTVSVLITTAPGRPPVRTDFAVGARPLTVALADVDADGDFDVVTASSTTNTITVLRNDGTGALGLRADFSTGAGPVHVALADVDGDGDVDAATVNTASNSVSVLINNGAADFSTRTDVAGTLGNSTLAAADMDGDGDPDLAVGTNSGSANSLLLLNNGAGLFAERRTVPISALQGMAVGDVDGDGDLDFVSSHAYGSSAIVVLRNDGAGNLSSGLPDVFRLPGNRPQRIALGDLDGDGDLDLVTTNTLDNNVSVLRNDGDGIFGTLTEPPSNYLAQAVDYVAGRGPRGMTLGDMDADGDLDIVTADYGGHSVTVLNNDGAGRFGRPIFPTGFGTRTVASADLNGDGHLDLVTADSTSATISVLFGDGTGAFGGRAAISIGEATTDAKVGDVDGDGDLDIVASAYVGASAGSRVYAFFNDGAGRFPSGASLMQGGFRPQALALGDVDRDGDLDIVTANNDLYTGAGLTVLLGRGDGTFAVPTDYVLSAMPQSLVLADVDGDGDLDAVTANGTANSASVLLNDGDGRFGSPRLRLGAPFAAAANNVAVGDVDGDGDLDVVATDGQTSRVVLLRNNGTSEFAVEAMSDFVGRLAIALGDVDADGDLDALTTDPYQSRVSVLINDGGGRFAAAASFAVGARPQLIAVLDVDGDGDTDFVTANRNGNSVSVLKNDGAGSFGARVDYATGTNPAFVELTDVDGDGDPDLVVPSPTAVGVAVLPNDGTGAFGAPRTVATGAAPLDVATGDVDGDGDNDLVIANGAGNTASLLLNDGTGRFGPRLELPLAANPAQVSLADADGDGDLDVIAGDFVRQALLRNDGTGRFAPREPLPAGTALGAPRFGDMDGDGDVDLVAPSAGLVAVLYNPGSGAFGGHPVYATGTNAQSVAVADVNGDGAPDLLAANSNAHTVSVLLNDGGGAFGQRSDFITGIVPRALAAADVDGDGDVDLVTANSSGNNISVLLNDGGGVYLTRLDFIVGTRPPRAVTLGDVDGDGDLDIITASYDDSSIAVLIVV